MHVILATSEAEIWMIELGDQTGQIVHETLSKITRAKWTGSVAQAVESLLCKCEALSLNPRPTKKKKKKTNQKTK
jgi:hypothetical protein